MTPELIKQLEKELKSIFHDNITITGSRKVHGGDISDCYELVTTGGNFFMKMNAQEPFIDMFKKEYNGLKHLYEKKGPSLYIPQPLAYGKWEGYQYLLMEFLHHGMSLPGFWEIFGQELAFLHRNTDTHFGFFENNYIGSLPQRNPHYRNWSEFYAQERLHPLLRLAFDEGLLETPFLKRTEYLFSRLPEIFPEEPPALLHGDLWSGNFSVGAQGQPCVFDPAVYYGHREMDLAMTRLFGGFDRRFYQSYEATFPLERGWQSRVRLCQLYPLLVHALLFGGHYIVSVKDILKEY